MQVAKIVNDGKINFKTAQFPVTEVKRVSQCEYCYYWVLSSNIHVKEDVEGKQSDKAAIRDLVLQKSSPKAATADPLASKEQK